ncbi:histidine phosphatase family protein [Rhodovulum sp. YNF3179]|uniref:histidine phosphatase family protein n=1 Tax=Rhodovulum sp. YNF3179 TaxID=3425127 RepID=UPI003D328A16
MRRWAALLTALLFLGPADARAGDSAWTAFAGEGVVALMRHALAPGIGDPEAFRLDDCATQRNLDADGRAQARAIGAAIRARDLEIDRVLSSQWCRCRETAALLDVGAVVEMPALNSFFGQRERAGPRTRATLDRIRALPATGRSIMVTHQVNIRALTGIAPRSGEIVLVRAGQGGPDGAGVTVLGRLTPAAP